MEHKNIARMSGKIIKLNRGYNSTKGVLEIERNSGVVDKIPFVTKQHICIHADWVTLIGRIQTRNVRGADGKTHKKTYVFADEVIASEEGFNHNEVEFEGVIVKKDDLRYAPKGKKLVDLIIAINDKNGSQYPSSIVWGYTAESIEDMPIGAIVYAKGRFQSRNYQKETEAIIRTAYEISINNLEGFEE